MFRNGKKIIIVYIMLTLLCLTLVFYIPNASASMWDGVWSEDTEDIVNFLLGHSNWLQFGNFITVTLHQIAWLFIKGLYMITSAIEGLIPESLNLLNFLDDSGMQGLFKSIINDLVSVLMILTIVYLGFKTVIAKEPPNFKSVGVNIFLSAFLILGLPSLMDTMEDVSLKFYDATQKAGNNSSANLSWNLIQNNTADLMYAADKGFDLIENDSDGTGSKNALTPETFFVVDLSEVITPKVIDKIDSPDSSIKSLKYKLSTDSNGKYTATEIDGGVLSFFSDSFDPGYFRYPAKFLPIIAGLIALVVAYIFTIFVFASTALEIGFKQVLAPIIFATDLETGQRTKMVVQDIGNAFMLIAFTGLSFRLYTMFLSFLGSSNINILIYVTAMIAATFILIKGSSTIMRYFGVDVGLKDGFAQIAGAFAIGRSTAHVGKSLRNLTKSGKKNDSPNSNKDALSEHVDSTRSVNDSKKGIGNTLKKSVNSAGKTVGYMRERGLTGMAEDAIKGTGEKIGNNINSKMKSLTDGTKGIKDSWKQGIEEGELNGLGNQIKWKQQKGKQEKSINDSDSSLSYENKGFLKSNDNNKNDTQKQKLQHDLNSINSSATSNISGDMKIKPSVSGINGNPNISGDMKIKPSVSGINGNSNISSDMKVKPSVSGINGNPNISGDMKIKPSVSGINGNSNISSDMKVKPSISSGNATQDVSVPNKGNVSSSVQKIIQQVEQKSFNDPQTAKQSIIQEVRNIPYGSEVKQRMIQEIEKASVASPQQLQQNVQQVLATANVPVSTQNAIQKVVQDVQKTSQSPEIVQAKVIQEIQKSSFGNETVKQTVIQDIQKAFAATPEQLQQNIKQVIEKTDPSSVTQATQEIKTKVTKDEQVNVRVNNQSNQKSYFKSILPPEFFEFEEVERKSSRFDKFKD